MNSQTNKDAYIDLFYSQSQQFSIQSTQLVYYLNWAQRGFCAIIWCTIWCTI